MFDEKALDRIEEAMQALVDSLAEEGLVGVMAYHIEQEKGVFTSHVLNGECATEDYLNALAQWSTIAADKTSGFITEIEE